MWKTKRLLGGGPSHKDVERCCTRVNAAEPALDVALFLSTFEEYKIRKSGGLKFLEEQTQRAKI
jgi:hypothetical protein